MIGPSTRAITVMVANGTADPLFDSDWEFRRLPFDAVVSVSSISTALGVLRQVTLGTDAQGNESPVMAGGTAGVFVQNKDDFDTFLGSAGDQIRIRYRETIAGTPSVMTVVKIQPIQG